MTGHRAMTAADRVVLVCGATSGIGEATARRLAASGVRLTLVGRRQAAGADLAAQLRAGGTDASFIVADMTVDAEAKAAVDHTLDRYGRLDGAFNNVGDVVSAGPVQTLTLTGWNAELAANLTSVFLGLKYQIPAILGTSGRGSIVNNAAVAGIVGVAGLSAYTAAKHGVIGLTRAAALEVAHKNVRINALVTGTVDTPLLRRILGTDQGETPQGVDFNPVRRLAHADEIGALRAIPAQRRRRIHHRRGLTDRRRFYRRVNHRPATSRRHT